VVSVQINGHWWHAAEDLAGGPELPGQVDDLNRRWGRSQPRQTRKALGQPGKGWLYPESCLPAATRAWLEARRRAELTAMLKAPGETSPRPPALPPGESLPGFSVHDRPRFPLPARPEQGDRQRAAGRARAALLEEVRRLERAGSRRRQAVLLVVGLAQAGELRPALQALVPVANDRSNGERSLSTGSLYRWFRLEAEGRPEPRRSREQVFEVPAWGPWLLKFYRAPQQPPLSQALQQAGVAMPAEIPRPSSLDQARRWLAKLGKVERLKGRLGPRELRTVLPFTRRSTDGLWPMDIVLPDGHCFDAEVQHPFHGQPFRPEITTYIDIATRRVVAFGVDLAESSGAILATLRQMIVQHGVPCIHYSDRGAYKAAIFSDAVTGILPRLGIEQEFSIAYNSQARGAIERLHLTLWVWLARMLDTYMGRGMDKQARQIAFKNSRRGRGLMAFEDFLRLAGEAVREYNGCVHRTLKASPDASWARAVAEGWEPVMVSGDDLDDLLPEALRTVQRGEVSLPWGRYFSADLREWHGDRVRVRYDLHDGSRVWVRDGVGRLLAVAIRDGNVRPYMPESAVEHARDQREKGRLGRLERHIDEARQERRGVIDLVAETVLPPDLQLLKEKLDAEKECSIPVGPVGGGMRDPSRDQELGQEAAVADAGGEGFRAPEAPGDRYALWNRLDLALKNGAELTARQADFHELYPKSLECRMLREKEAEGQEGGAEGFGRRAAGR
jgi:putative transposase